MKKPAYPRGETVCVSYHDRESNLVCIMTQKDSNGLFYLYELKDNVFVKLGKGEHSPAELEEKFEVDRRMGIT